MYEHNTKAAILERMLSHIPNDADKREGSIIYDALLPAALELSYAYAGLDIILAETFGDTAGREMLIKRALERGLEPTPAVAAEYLCLSDTEIPIGTVFTSDELYFTAEAFEGDGLYRLKCRTAGKVGNTVSGKFIPVQYIPNFNKITLISCAVTGEDEEDTEHFRKRFMSSYETAYFGGNKQDYKTKVGSLNNVGGCKIYPAWNGGGTVKIVICDKDYKSPSKSIVDEVQELIDPLFKTGEGIGIAPIGHRVTVCAADAVVINIDTCLTLEDEWNFEDIRELAHNEIDNCLKELSVDWENEDKLVVRISRIEARLLEIPHVIDVKNTAINGVAENLILEPDSVPERGTLNDRLD